MKVKIIIKRANVNIVGRCDRQEGESRGAGLGECVNCVELSMWGVLYRVKLEAVL